MEDFIIELGKALKENNYQLPSERLYERIGNILIRPDSRYSDYIAQYIASCFIVNNAIVILKIKLNRIKFPEKCYLILLFTSQK